MKTPNLIASAAAVLLTFASLSVVNYNVVSQPVKAASTRATEITTLPPVQVRPSAAELRTAALLTDIGNAAGIATIPSMIQTGESGNTDQLKLFGSELAMPYYSFGNKFGRITKE